MNCDMLMSLSSTDNTWSALLPFNLWYQWGKLQANKGFVSLAQTERDFKKQRARQLFVACASLAETHLTAA